MTGHTSWSVIRDERLRRELETAIFVCAQMPGGPSRQAARRVAEGLMAAGWTRPPAFTVIGNEIVEARK